MRLGWLGIGASAMTLGACSVLSLDGLAGSAGGSSDSGAGGDAPVDVAPVDGGGGGGSDAGDSAAANDGPATGTDGTAPADTGTEVGVDSPALPPYRIVFVTSQLYGGNLGGIGGADGKCQTLAKQAGLPGTFLAWISDGATTPASRMPHENLPYVLADGQTQVASDWNQLLSGSINFPINMTELKTQITPVPSCGPQGYLGNFVWTDTNNAAVQWNAGDTCTSWGSAAAGQTGSTGNASSTTYWTAWCVGVPCNVQAALYCVQQ